MDKKVILFDLDGTLLPMDQDQFIQTYFHALAKWTAPYGYEEDKLIQAIWKSIQAITVNQDGRSNEELFWETFQTMFDFPVSETYDAFLDFYRNGFVQAKPSTSPTPKPNQLVQMLKEKGYPMALATNPFFPKIATQQRIHWAGLDENDFLFYTTYEDSYSCKPNVQYYLEVASRCQVSPSQCIMVGNDVKEDGVAKECGMEVFLLTDCLINTEHKDLTEIPHGSFEDLEQWLIEKEGD